MPPAPPGSVLVEAPPEEKWFVPPTPEPAVLEPAAVSIVAIEVVTPPLPGAVPPLPLPPVDSVEDDGVLVFPPQATATTNPAHPTLLFTCAMQPPNSTRPRVKALSQDSFLP